MEQALRLEIVNIDVTALLNAQFRSGQVSTSCRPWQTNIARLNLPSDVRGLSILDVGAGGSDLTAKFLRDGANAYAVDTLYGGSSVFSIAINGCLEFWKNTDRGNYARTVSAYGNFDRSFRRYPERYRAASAIALPFEDNKFDIVLSVDAVLPWCAYDFGILQKIINELVRVTKVGGKIQLVDYEGDGAIGTNPQYRENHAQDFINERRLVNVLGQNPKLAYEIETITTVPENKRLVITKSAE